MRRDLSIERRIVPDLLLRGVAIVAAEQGPSGEILATGGAPDGSEWPRRRPLLSCWVHEALGCFSPSSPEFEVAALELIPSANRLPFVRQVRDVRRRLRRFLAWQESCSNSWCFSGRSGGLPADLDTTARAATVLLETSRPNPRRWRRHTESLWRLYAISSPDNELVALTNMLHFLAQVGEEVAALVPVLDRAIETDSGTADRRYRNQLFLFHTLARTWRRTRLPDLEPVIAQLRVRVARQQTQDGGFDGPLSAALAASTLLELGDGGPLLAVARRALVHSHLAPGGRFDEELLGDGTTSPACTMALCMNALARATVAEAPSEQGGGK